MDEIQKKIGLYGGTFDPIHFGHINLAIELSELCGLDEVWFCPAQANPLKAEAPTSPGKHRLAMLHLAVDPIANFRVIENELNREAPSFTVDTCKELVERYPENKFSLLLGEDSVSSFFRWNQPLEIIQMMNVLVGSRTGEFEHARFQGENQKIIEALQQGMTQTRLMDISGKMIRDRLSRGLSCCHLLPGKVIDYINENRLYSINKNY